MAGIILYRSKYGASEQYARMLAKETGLKRPLAIRGAVDADVYGMLQKGLRLYGRGVPCAPSCLAGSAEMTAAGKLTADIAKRPCIIKPPLAGRL